MARNIIFLVGVGCLASGAPPAQHDLLHYNVSLDAGADTRFTSVWSDFIQHHGVESFRETYAGWQKWLLTALPELFGTPEAADATAHAWLDVLRRSHPDAAAELAALSSALLAAGPEPLFEPAPLAVGISLYPLVVTSVKNTTDTKPSACTSTLARASGGRVLHGRSLDFEPRDPIAASTVVMDFRRGDKLAYRCLQPLTYTTALNWLTCERPGAFSLSVNARQQGMWNEHNTSFAELLRRAEGQLLLGELAERAMQAGGYDDALAVLSSLPAVSSNYFILAGANGEGAIVTRFGNSSSADIWALGSSSSWSDGQPPWLRVQTNVDHWVDFSSGAYATHRRQRAIEELAALGSSGIDRDSLMGVYLTDHARQGSENRSTPEDVGVILRPSTIATVIFDPAAQAEDEPDPRYWRIWAASPTILPPTGDSEQATETVVTVV